MKTFWKTIAKYSIKLAVYAVENPRDAFVLLRTAQAAAKRKP